MMCNVTARVCPPTATVIVAFVSAAITRVWTVNVAVLDPALTVRDAGTVAAPSLLEIVTGTPPPGAAPLSVNVPSLDAPATTLVEASDTCESVALGPVGVPQPTVNSARMPTIRAGDLIIDSGRCCRHPSDCCNTVPTGWRA